MSFTDSDRDNSHMLTGLPVGGIHNIFLVALVHLPSPLAGPVSPGMLDQVINSYHHFNCSCRVSIFLTSCAAFIFIITVVAESPEVVVSGEGSGVTGTSYTLTCSVSLPIGIQEASPNIQWKRPNMLLSSSSSLTNTSRGFLATLQLQSLQSTDEGEYICLAGYYLGNISSPLVMNFATLHVNCKSTFEKVAPKLK